MKKPICFLPVNEQAVNDIAEARRGEIARAPRNSTIMVRVVIDPHGRVSPATKIIPERFPLRDSESGLDSA